LSPVCNTQRGFRGRQKRRVVIVGRERAHSRTEGKALRPRADDIRRDGNEELFECARVREKKKLSGTINNKKKTPAPERIRAQNEGGTWTKP